MSAVVFHDLDLQIPLGISSLDDFRRWSHSDDFPETGRIDYIAGNIEVDMAPEDLFVHGTLNGEIYVKIHQVVVGQRLGSAFIDSTRIVSPAALLSAEPDVVFLSYRRRRDGTVNLVPKASGEAGRYIEIEGPPDLVVEVISDSSGEQDTVRLRSAYFRAGIGEFWLADARGEQLRFEILTPGTTEFKPVAADAGGYQNSPLLRRAFRLDRQRNEFGDWEFGLLVRQ